MSLYHSENEIFHQVPSTGHQVLELVGGRWAVGGHQLSTNVALSHLLWTKPGFKGCLTDGWRPVLADKLGGVLHCGMVVPNSRHFTDISQRVGGLLMQ